MSEQQTPINAYIQEVRAIPKLSREQEHELALRAQKGDRSASDALVKANLRYAVALALQYRRYGIPLGDLIAEGNLGLMTAVKKFDPHAGTRFVTYAGYWMRAFILETVVRSATMVGAGSGPFRSKLYFKLRRQRAKLSNLIQDRDELLHTMSKEFGVKPERMQELLQRLDQRETSLDAPLRADTKLTVLDSLANDQTPSDEVLEAKRRQDELSTSVSKALHVLDPRERLIVERRMLKDESDSLASLGRRLGISRERARQLEARAKRKLQEALFEFAPAA